MFDKLRTSLQGKKFYLTALAGILATIVAWGNGTVDDVTAGKAIWEALLGCAAKAAFDRHAENAIKLLLVAILILPATGCGYHMVKYDPHEAAVIAAAMEDNGTKFALSSCAAPNVDSSVWAQWQAAFIANTTKFRRLVSEGGLPSNPTAVAQPVTGAGGK